MFGNDDCYAMLLEYISAVIQFPMLISINIYLTAVDCFFYVYISWIEVHLHMSCRLIFTRLQSNECFKQRINTSSMKVKKFEIEKKPAER